MDLEIPLPLELFCLLACAVVLVVPTSAPWKHGPWGVAIISRVYEAGYTLGERGSRARSEDYFPFFSWMGSLAPAYGRPVGSWGARGRFGGGRLRPSGRGACACRPVASSYSCGSPASAGSFLETSRCVLCPVGRGLRAPVARRPDRWAFCLNLGQGHSQSGSLAGAAHLLNDNAGVLR